MNIDFIENLYPDKLNSAGFKTFNSSGDLDGLIFHCKIPNFYIAVISLKKNKSKNTTLMRPYSETPKGEKTSVYNLRSNFLVLYVCQW